MGFKIATAYARLSQSLLGIFQKKKKKTWTQKIQLLNPRF